MFPDDVERSLRHSQGEFGEESEAGCGGGLRRDVEEGADPFWRAAPKVVGGSGRGGGRSGEDADAIMPKEVSEAEGDFCGGAEDDSRGCEMDAGGQASEDAAQKGVLMILEKGGQGVHGEDHIASEKAGSPG
jgi:hypothetical protein